MPPNQEQEVTPTQQSEKTGNNFKLNIKLLFPLIVLLFLIIFAILITKSFITRPPQTSEIPPVIVKEDGWYASNITNTKFLIPIGWSLDTSEPALPYGFNKPSVIVRKNNSSCIIAQVGRDFDKASEWKQISFSDRVVSDYAQFDGNWYIPKQNSSSTYTFSGHERQYLDEEFRFSYGAKESFVLLMRDNKPVPDDCNEDLNLLIKSTIPYYEKMNLTSSSIGTLTIDRISTYKKLDSNEQHYELLLFTDRLSEEKRKVMAVPENSWTDSISVLNNKLYIPTSSYETNDKGLVVDGKTAISVIDPFKETIVTIPGTEVEGGYITSIYLHKGNAYYLLDTTNFGMCLDSYKLCTTNLYSVPISGGDPVLIASTKGSSILGYNEGEKTFYISESWGDAGCSSITITKIVNGQEYNVIDHSYCDTPDEEIQSKINKIIQDAGSSKTYSMSINIENGILSPSTSQLRTNNDFSFDK